MSNRRATEQRLSIDGPAGRLQALLAVPAPPRIDALCVICHPHPQHGGTMTNKVVHTLARTLNEQGIETLRFNFRGVGASEGSYGDGEGELQDALAVLEWARTERGRGGLWLGGFSFGACVALRAAGPAQVRQVVAIAPAIERCRLQNVEPLCPWLIIQGERDELVDARAVGAWAQQLSDHASLAVLDDADHFFHGRLIALRELLHEQLADAVAAYPVLEV